MNTQTNPLLATLMEAGLVYAEPPTTETPDSPWYVKVLLAFSGWLAAIFLLFFIGLGFHNLVDSKTALCITGLFMIGAAIAGLFRIRDNDFLEHLMLAFSMAGHIMLWAALLQDDRDVVFSYWLASVFEALLAIIVPNVLHRIFSSSAAALAMLAAILHSFSPNNIFYIISTLYANTILFFTAFLWLNEFCYPLQMKKMQAIAYGFLLFLIPLNISISTFHDYGNQFLIHWVSWIPWINALTSTAIMCYVNRYLLFRTNPTASINLQIAIFTASICVGIVSVWMPGITIGIVLIALGFSASNRVLLGLGIASLLGFISHYYYALHTTLLYKSMTLAIAGVLLLLVRWMIMQWLTVSPEMRHGQ
jgi:uncharacterized membrane protein